MKEYIDVTLPLESGQVIYPGDIECEVKRNANIREGDKFNITSLSLSAHTGTHMDAPYHFFDFGQTIDEIPSKYLIGKAKVFDFTKKDYFVDIGDLENKNIDKGDIILIKTKNSRKLMDNRFYEDFIYLITKAAQYLLEKQIYTLGFDYFSVDKFGSEDYPVHKTLLGNNIIIIEGINLLDIEEGEYEIIALPLRIKGADGSPIRVMLKPI